MKGLWELGKVIRRDRNLLVNNVHIVWSAHCVCISVNAVEFIAERTHYFVLGCECALFVIGHLYIFYMLLNPKGRVHPMAFQVI